MPLLTLDQVKDWIKKTDDENDDVLEDLMERAIEAVQRELDWYFGDPRATVEILNGLGLPTLWLRQPPVGAAVEVFDRSGPTAAWNTVDADLYELDGRGVYHDSCWLRGFRNYRVEYEEGFDSPPGDVQQFTLDLVAQKWLSPRGLAKKSEKLGRYSYTLGDLEQTTGWTNVVANWKRGRV